MSSATAVVKNSKFSISPPTRILHIRIITAMTIIIITIITIIIMTIPIIHILPHQLRHPITAQAALLTIQAEMFQAVTTAEETISLTEAVLLTMAEVQLLITAAVQSLITAAVQLLTTAAVQSLTTAAVLLTAAVYDYKIPKELLSGFF